MGKHTVFIDESGNTGANFTDESQPILLLLGIGIPYDLMPDILLKLDEIKISFGYTVDHEIHAKNIAKRNRENLCIDILNLLMEHSFSLFLSISEKKYILASLVYDDLFDPVHNDTCDVTWTYPSLSKSLRANFIYNNLSKDTLLACGQAFRNGDQMNEAYNLLLRDLKDKTCDVNLYAVLQGAKPHLHELSRAIASSAAANHILRAPAGVIRSPNFLGFCGLTNKVEQFYAAQREDVNIVFDHARQYTIAFSEIFKRLRDAERIGIETDGKLPLLLGYNALKQFEADRSHQNAFLQLADLLATSFKDCLLKTYRGIELSAHEENLLLLLVGYWQEFGDTFCDFLISESFLEDIGIKMRSILNSRN